MTIKEVEELLEVPRATVRFYEKEGLINPQREGDSKDNIFAVKWWYNYRNMEAIGSACRRLNAAKKSYEEVTNRECEARIVIITLRIFEDRMKKWADDIPRKIDTYGFKIQVMAEEDL